MFRSFLIALGFVAAGALLTAHAQDPNEYRVRKIPPPPDISSVSPFKLDSKQPLAVRFVPAEAMSTEDKDVVKSAQQDIHRLALAEGFEGVPANWKQTQLECPAFPQHVLLRFTRTEGGQSASMFSAAIPRGAQGHVRLIPVLRRGYSLFSPAPTNKITVAIFNRILAEEHSADKPNWGAVSLCYAALAGSSGSEPDANGVSTLQPLNPPVLEIDPGTQEAVRLVLGAPSSKIWQMIFDRDGKLVKADATASGEATMRTVPATPSQESGASVRHVPPPPAAPSVQIPAEQKKPQ